MHFLVMNPCSHDFLVTSLYIYICDLIFQKMLVMHKDKYLEMHNSIIQEYMELLPHNISPLYSYTV